MERGEHLKKACLYFLLFMVLVASLTGCGRKRKVKINGSYNEWIDAMGINEYTYVYCSGYKEYDNGVEICISPFNSETADEFKKILDNHNAFVTRNPDYFPKGFNIDMKFECCGGNVKLFFSNYAETLSFGKNYADYVDVSSIETEDSCHMRYVYQDMGDERINTKFEAETIIISIGKGIQTAEKAHDWSEDFENLDTIVVKISPEVEAEINVGEALEKIQEANPDAEIYYKTYSNELTKYVPEEKSN